MAVCKYKKRFYGRECGEEILVEGGNYCLEHGCSYLCVFKNQATCKTSFGKNVCKKCLNKAEGEHKKIREEKLEIKKEEAIRGERIKEFKKSNDETIASIKSASSNFWQAIEGTFEILRKKKELMIGDVKIYWLKSKQPLLPKQKDQWFVKRFIACETMVMIERKSCERAKEMFLKSF